MKQVAVIGAGISGLAAALALAEQTPDVQVTLFEGSDRVGGVLETIHDGRYLVERSADNFATLIPNALELSRRCGLESELISPEINNRQALVLHRGKLLPIPAGFSLMQPTRIGSIMSTRTLSWSAKLRLLGEFWVPRRAVDEDESLESFSTRRLGRETYENLVEPIVSGIFTADPATLSMRATMPQFVEMEQRTGGLIRGHLAARKQDVAAAARRASGARYDQFVAPRQGMNWWVNALAQRLPARSLKLNTRVLSLRSLAGPTPEVAKTQATDAATGRAWQIETASESLTFDGVICSAPAAITARLLSESLPAAATIVATIPYASSAVVAMAVDHNELRGRTDAFGLIVPRKEGRQTLAISFASNKYPARVPNEQLLLRIFLGGALSPETVELSDSQLIALAHTELRDILGWTGTAAKWQAVMRWREAMPQYVLGHLDRMQQLQQQLATFPTLKLCGAGYAGVGIPQCVRGGEQAASALVARLNASGLE
ncbi:MAG: protoporphyrinogen oxidase [Pirellulaceae bacterium]|nr:protoporphyrinogen oxidase [Pirellulaceae bacterium]